MWAVVFCFNHQWATLKYLKSVSTICKKAAFSIVLLPPFQNGQIHVGYKDLVENYQLLVTNLAKKREEKEVKLVLNLFQSLLDEFIRGYTKKEESEQPKVWNLHCYWLAGCLNYVTLLGIRKLLSLKAFQWHHPWLFRKCFPYTDHPHNNFWMLIHQYETISYLACS